MSILSLPAPISHPILALPYTDASLQSVHAALTPAAPKPLAYGLSPLPCCDAEQAPCSACRTAADDWDAWTDEPIPFVLDDHTIPADLDDPEFIEDEGVRLTLPEVVFAVANQTLDWGTDTGRLISDTLADLARKIEASGARTVREYERGLDRRAAFDAPGWDESRRFDDVVVMA